MRQIAIPIEIEMFTDNPRYLEFIEHDPLRLKHATSRFFFENFLLSLKAASAAKHLSLPVLLIQTDKDAIVDCVKVERWYNQVISRHKSRQVFPDVSHSIDFDSNCFNQYVESVRSWIEKTAVPA